MRIFDLGLKDEINQLTYKLRDVTRFYESNDKDRERLLSEVQTLMAQRRDLEDSRSAIERDLIKASTMNDALKQQIKDKDEVSEHYSSHSLRRSSTESSDTQ